MTDRRGQTELVGYTLILMIVVVSASSVAYFGGAAVTELRGSVNTQNAEHAMREADSRLSQVAFSANDAHTLDFSALDGETQVTSDGRMEVTMRNGSYVCTGELRFGTIETRASDGDVVAYQAGGVWQMTDGGAVMLSPPDMQYRNGTFSFQLVNVSGSATGSVRTLQAEKDMSASRSKSGFYRQTFGNQSCNPPDNVTISVDSHYYRAWGTFFRTHFADGTVVVDDDERLANITLELAGGTTSVDDGSNTVSTDANVTATVEVVGTELSSSYADDGKRYKRNGPTTFRVLADGTAFTPWYDDDLTDAIVPQEDDLNDPVKGEHFTYSFERDGGVAISAEATSYGCYDYDTTDITNEYNGETYTEVRCSNVGNPNIQISSSSNSGNLVILEDGDEVPDFTAAGDEQRGLDDILGSRIDDEGRVQLDKNEFVFLFELSEPNADPDDASDSGDPDYNDAVIVLTITEDNAVEAPENFAIHISVNEVVVTEK